MIHTLEIFCVFGSYNDTGKLRRYMIILISQEEAKQENNDGGTLNLDLFSTLIVPIQPLPKMLHHLQRRFILKDINFWFPKYRKTRKFHVGMPEHASKDDRISASARFCRPKKRLQGFPMKEREIIWKRMFDFREREK